MSAPVENFSLLSPETYDQSSAVSHELKVLSERPAPQDTRMVDQTSSNHLPEVTVHDGTTPTPQPKHEENRLGLLENVALNNGIGAAVIFGAEALGAVVFHSPKLAEAAIETAAGTAKLGLAATETAALASKFGFLTGDAARILGKSAIFAGSAGAGVAARHYSYEALTGHQESWNDSATEVGKGVITVGLTRRIMGYVDKFLPST